MIHDTQKSKCVMECVIYKTIDLVVNGAHSCGLLLDYKMQLLHYFHNIPVMFPCILYTRHLIFFCSYLNVLIILIINIFLMEMKVELPSSGVYILLEIFHYLTN